MHKLEQNLSAFMNSAMDEINNLNKVLIFEKTHNVRNYELLAKYVPVIIFSIWEGFFKDSIKEYYSYFNRNENFERDFQMLTNIIEHHDIIKENYKHFNSKQKLVERIKDTFDNPKFEERRPHINTTDFKKTNTFLEHIKIKPLNNEYSYDYGRLAALRNQVAHGEDIFPVKEGDIDNYVVLIRDLMKNLEENILYAMENN